MKTRLKNILAFSLVILLLFGFTACEADRIENTYIQSSKVITRNFTIQAGHWQWNDEYKRYERRIVFPEMDDALYEHGAVLGTIFIVEHGKEMQRTLPFVQSYTTGANNFTETISFDIGNDPYNLCFYIQTSDLTDTSPYIDEYTFKVSFIWDSGQ